MLSIFMTYVSLKKSLRIELMPFSSLILPLPGLAKILGLNRFLQLAVLTQEACQETSLIG